MTSENLAYQKLLEEVPCNLCGSSQYTVIHPPRYDLARPDKVSETFRSSGDEMLLDQLVRCDECGLMYLNPRLKSEVIIEAYSGGQDPAFFSQAQARERTFDRSLGLIEKHLPHKGRVLDVGTAGGSFLAAAHRRGWEVAGCEPNRWLAREGGQHYGIDIHAGTIFDMNLEDAGFDLVTLWDVLEHTPDPLAVLAECRRVLKPGGLLVVNYPDIASLPSRAMGRRWVFLLSVHLYYFTPQTIRAALEKSGFTALLLQKHWQTLELGYIMRRMEPYLGAVARLGGKGVRALGLGKASIPYWMGQTLVISRRNGPEA
ncbi:MAG: class I SAM-dependent methyltransferase [Desulfarculaceae bacterium]|jgi:SAM-dependent methyltransferase